MALKIRLQRGGARHNPVYRIVVAESRYARDGRFVEQLGTYAPRARGKDQEVILNKERALYWMGIGAQPSETVRSMIKKAPDSVEAPETEEAAEAPAEATPAS